MGRASPPVYAASPPVFASQQLPQVICSSKVRLIPCSLDNGPLHDSDIGTDTTYLMSASRISHSRSNVCQNCMGLLSPEGFSGKFDGKVQGFVAASFIWPMDALHRPK